MLAIAPEVINGLLHRLSCDDDFRTLMEKNPSRAFELAGIDVPARDLLMAGRLASKGQLADERAAYVAKIIGDAPADVFFFLFA